MSVRSFSLKNNGAFVAKLRVHATHANGKTDSKTTGSFAKGSMKILDLTEYSIFQEGDIVWLEAVVVAGKNRKASERFVYSRYGTDDAKYSVKGTTLSNSLKFEGLCIATLSAPSNNISYSYNYDYIQFEYLKTYPENKSFKECNGICHDRDYWYMTQYGCLWKFPIGTNFSSACKSNTSQKGRHFGDLDYYQGYLFIPKSYDNGSDICVYDANTLTEITYQEFNTIDGKKWDSMGWVAINPRDGKLYTASSGLNDSNPIRVFTIDMNAIRSKSKHFLNYYGTVKLRDENGKVLTRDWMQGGCFDNDNHLYLSNGCPTDWQGGTKYRNMANEDGGISVYRIENNIAKRICHSNQSSGFRFQFNGFRQEPEGLTYWDLDADSRSNSNVKGQLHAIMIDNEDAGSVGTDKLYLKHFRKVVTSNLKITKQPSNLTVTYGNGGTFSVTATSSKTPLRYQWYRCDKNGYNYSIKENSWYTGGSTSTFTVKKTSGEDMNGYVYCCVITDAAGKQVTSNKVTLTVLQPAGALTITTQPKDGSAKKGAFNCVTYTVAVQGGKAPYSYQWQFSRDGVSWGSFGYQEQNYFTVAHAETSGYYRCEIKDATGAKVTSNKAAFKVL